MADIQEYSVSIKFKTEGSEKASKDADKVKDSIGKLKGSTKGFDGLKTGLSSVGKFTGKAATALKAFSVATGAALVKAGKSASKYSKEMMDYIETVNLFRTSMGDLADKAMEFVNRGQFELGLNPKEMMDALSSFQNLSEGFGIASDRAYIMSKNLTQLSGDLSSFANISFDQAQKKLMAGFSGQVMPLRKYGIALDQASLQETAYSLGLDQRVKTMTRAQKSELIYYQIMKSTQKMQGDLGRTLMSPANALRVMQNEFKSLARAVGSIFIPIMQKIIPIMRMVTKALTQAAQAIASFFGFKISDYTADLSGLSDGFGDIGGDIEDVGDAAEGTAKKMNKMLMPFDELNNISSNQGSGSGAGAGGGIGGGSLGIELPEYDMFEFIDDRIPKFGDILEKFRETAHKLNELLAGIDWNTIKEGAGNIGKSLAEFLNIGITEIDWNLIGKSFGEGLNSIIELVYNFVNTFKFGELGKSVSDAINGLFTTVEWDKLAETLSKGISGVLTAALEFKNNLDEGAIFDAIAKFIENIDWGSIASKAGTLMIRSILDPSRIIRGITLLVDIIGDALGKAIQGAGSKIEEAGGNIFVALFKGIEEIHNKINGWVYDNMIKPILDALQDTHIGKAFAKVGSFLMDKIIGDPEEFKAKFERMMGQIEEWAFDTTTGIKQGVSDILSGLWGAILRGAQNAVNAIVDGINRVIQGINEVGGYLGVHLNELSRVTWADEYDKKMEEAKKKTTETVNQMSNTVSSKIKEAAENAKTNTNVMAEETIKDFDRIKNASTQDFTETETVTSQKTKNIQDLITNAFAKAKEAATTDTNTLKIQTESKLSEVANSSVYSRIQSSIRSAFDNAQIARTEAEATGAGYTSGLENKIRAEAIKNSVKNDIKRMFASYNETYNWGTDMARGISDGLDANQQRIIEKVRGMADSIRRLLHFSRPDEGPLRDYETWMPDMIKGLSDSLIQAAPILDNAVNQIADRMAESLGNIEMPDVEQSLFVNQNNSQVIRNIGNRTNNATQDNVTGNMIRATYEAVSRALVENKGKEGNRQIIVNVGNKELYRGYGQYQDEESNMLGITV